MMPLSQAKKLGLLSMKPITMEIELADGTSRKPVGKLLNIHVKLNGSYALVDFVVLALDEQWKWVILGRPFLATNRASISNPKRRIKLRFKDTSMTFYVDTVDRVPTMNGQAFIMKDVDSVAAVHPMDMTPGSDVGEAPA